jgi:hypothetical protein
MARRTAVELDINLPLGIALLGLCAAIAAQALRLLRQGSHPASSRSPEPLEPAEADAAPEPSEIRRAARIDHAHQQDLRAALARHHAELAEAEATIAQASAYVCRTGLTFAVTWLWEELAAGCELVAGADLLDEPEGPAWRWQEAKWRISRELHSSAGPDGALAHFSVVRDGDTLLALACRRDAIALGGHYRFVSVEALEMGPWVADLVDFAGTMRTALEMARARRQVESTLRAAARIRLGQRASPLPSRSIAAG